jgi:hypothetical protein
MGIKGLLPLLLCTLLLPVSSGWAGEIHGRSSTQLFSFANELTDGSRQVELDEYLQLYASKLNKGGNISVYGYGRLGQDFTNSQGTNGRLYYLYGDFRDLLDKKIDLKVGRQFVNLAAGSAIIDGIQLDIKDIGPVGFTVLGGRDVIYGINGGELGNFGNADLGIAAYLAGVKKTDLEISWFRKWDRGDVARDLLAVNAKQYLFNNLQIYGLGRFDLVTETFNEVQGGIKYFPRSNIILTAEYYQSYPLFDTTSIYSVFAVDRYREMVYRADYIFNEKLSANVGYNREWYSEGEGGVADVWHVGVGIRPIDPLRINIEFDNRHGYYGRHDGVISDVTYDIGKIFEVAAGFDWDVYRRDSMTGEETARRYWLSGKYKLAKNMAVTGRIQDDVNHEFTKNIYGRLVFDYDF